MSTKLSSQGLPVKVGSVTLMTPGLEGQATSHAPGSHGMRSAEAATNEFNAAQANTNLQVQETIEITNAREVPAPTAFTRSTTFGEPAVQVEVPDPGKKWGQVVLHTDQGGVMTWHLAVDNNNKVVSTRGRGTRTYLIRRQVVPSLDVGQTRGITTAIGKKIIKVLVFPLLDPLIGEVSSFFASRWETKRRPYRMRQFSPDDYQSASPPLVDDAGWERLGQGRALLIVHGTFSQTHSGFAGFSPQVVQDLNQIYGGRVFAFDHPTISEDPTENAKKFVEMLPQESKLDIDIICHSRGGLVSRALAEKQGELSVGARTLTVRRIVFVATPNAGTVLTDSKYLGSLVDRYTNLLNFFPDTGLIDVLDAIITVVKQLAVAAYGGLDGLQSMLPGGAYLADLNSGGGAVSTDYYAMASNYEPQPGALREFLRDQLADKIFKAENDLIVPTSGVFAANGDGKFPISNHFVFSAQEYVQHGGFFANQKACQKMQEWLSAQ